MARIFIPNLMQDTDEYARCAVIAVVESHVGMNGTLDVIMLKLSGA